MQFEKVVNLFDRTLNDKDLPRFITNNELKFMIKEEEMITT